MPTLNKYFRVTIPAAVDTETVGDGFIDDRKASDNSFTQNSTTNALSLLKATANLRWEKIVDALHDTGADAIVDIDKTGGDEDNAPTVIAFTVVYNEGEVVHMYDLVTDTTGNTIYGPANSNLSDLHTVTVATEPAVIERAIATTLSRDEYKYRREILTPDKAKNTRTIDDVTVKAFGTGLTHALRMASIEAVGTFTVTQLPVNA